MIDVTAGPLPTWFMDTYSDDVEREFQWLRRLKTDEPLWRGCWSPETWYRYADTRMGNHD